MSLQLSLEVEETLRSERVMETAAKDMMSELPNCLLVSILSMLSIKDAVKTSILSRRWRHLFMLIPNLVVDSANIFSDGQDHRRFTLSNYYDGFDKERHEFVMRVDQLMQQQQLMHERHIRSLTVRFFIDSEYSSHLDGWLKVAIASGLTKLELSLSEKHNFSTRFIVEEDHQYNFPCWLFSETSLRCLRLEKCVLRTPADFKGFRNLTTLELNSVILSEDFATQLLPSCSLLEQLTLVSCRLKSNLLCFDHPYLQLKHLKVLHCFPEPIIKISSMNLTTFEHCGDMTKIAHLYAPQLKQGYFSAWGHSFSLAHFSTIAKLEILLLCVEHHQVRNIPTISLSSFATLKQLSLFLLPREDESGLSWVISFLKAAPLLQKFVLVLTGGEVNTDIKKIQRLDGVHPDQLEEVEIHGCLGNWYEIELQLFLLRTASRLKRLIISPSNNMYAGNGAWIDVSFGKAGWEQSQQQMVRSILESHVPQGVQLLFP